MKTYDWQENANIKRKEREPEILTGIGEKVIHDRIFCSIGKELKTRPSIFIK